MKAPRAVQINKGSADILPMPEDIPVLEDGAESDAAEIAQCIVDVSIGDSQIPAALEGRIRFGALSWPRA